MKSDTVKQSGTLDYVSSYSAGFLYHALKLTVAYSLRSCAAEAVQRMDNSESVPHQFVSLINCSALPACSYSCDAQYTTAVSTSPIAFQLTSAERSPYLPSHHTQVEQTISQMRRNA